MKKATIRSVCECQANLAAELDEQRHVLVGTATDTGRRKTLTSPAHSIGADESRFDVAWFCPFCNRNTMRSFDAGGLAYVEA